ncbi:MAG: DEAD/DEAH box helicase [Spirochaetales bacterium]|nr:DEAD/DEAH box helicase [Spirochaetales bacterium]
MTLSLTLADLAHRYPSDICNRGIDLYNDGRVGDLFFEEGTVEAEVEGDRDSYTVRVSLNNRGVPVDTDCSCSYCFQAGHCSHIIALLVKLINEKVQLVTLSGGSPGAEVLQEHRFEDFPVSPLDRGREGEYYISLESPEQESPLTDLSRPSELSPSAVLPSKTRWKGTLNLRLRRGEWRIGAALLYVKKDGTPGRLDRNFSLTRVTEPLSPEEERIFRLWSLIPHGPEEGLLFDKVASLVLEDREKLSLINDKGFLYRFLPAEKMGLSFNPTLLPSAPDQGWEGGLFEAEFTLNPLSEEIFTGQNILHLGQDRLYLASPTEARVYYFDLTEEGRKALFDYLLSRREKPFRIGEIEALKREFAPSFDDRLSWDFSPARIRCRTVVPGTILTCHDPGTGGSVFKLSFDYGPLGIVPYGQSGGPLQRCREEDSPDTMVLFYRDQDREREIFRWLENWFLTLYGPVPFSSLLNRLKGRYDFLAEKDLNDFLTDRGDELLDRGIELRLERQKGRLARGSGGEWRFKGAAYKEWLSLSLSNEEGVEVDLEDFLQGGLLRSGSELIVISSRERDKLRKILERGELKEGRLILSPHDYEALELMEESFALSEEEEFARIKERARRLREFEQIEEVPLPSDFQGTLRPYQKGGYHWLHFLFRYGLGGCLADDMGLGKTVQTLCFLQSLKERNRLGQTLLLAPVTTLTNWKREAEKFTPTLKVLIHSGGRRGRSREELSHVDLVLASYQTFLRDAEWLKKEHWTCLILDEAQAVKNWQSRTRQAVKGVEARFRLALTGTPVENGMIELWSLFDLLEPGLLGTRDMFRRRYQLPMERDGDKTRRDELKKRVTPLMLRRKKEEVLDDLPEKEETLVWLEMGEEQRAVYDKVRRSFLALIEETLKDKDVTQAAMEILTALLRLRQLAVVPALADERYGEVPACKMDFLEYFLDDLEAEDHRVLIFSQFVSALKIVRERLEQRGTAYAYLDGSTANREEVIGDFQRDDGPPVFLISLKAGGVGINLTSADYVLLLDPWWNPAVENQAVDRAYRIGQNRSVMVYKPIVRDTVEEKILELQQSKRDLAAELITEDKGFLKSLSREEITELFR